MKDDKRRARLAALFGMAPPTQEELNEAVDKSREAEAALAYYNEPSRFKEVTCKQCGLRFAVNRGSVAYCSDSCRRKMLADIGIEWDPNKTPEERWKPGVEPFIVTPQALQAIQVRQAYQVLVDAGLVPELESSGV